MRFGQGMGIPFNMNGHRYESVPRGPVPLTPRPSFVSAPGGPRPYLNPNEPPPVAFPNAVPQSAEVHLPTAGASGSSEPQNQSSQPAQPQSGEIRIRMKTALSGLMFISIPIPNAGVNDIKEKHFPMLFVYYWSMREW